MKLNNLQIQQLKRWISKNALELHQTKSVAFIYAVAVKDLGFPITFSTFQNHFYAIRAKSLKTPEQGVDVRVKGAVTDVMIKKEVTQGVCLSDTLTKLIPTIRALENRPDSKELENKIAQQTKIIEQLKASATSKEVSLMQIINDQKTEILSLRKTIEELETEVYAVMSAPQISFKLNY